MKLILKVGLFMVVFQGALFAGDTAGHGGDGIRFIFTSARDEASLRVSKFVLKMGKDGRAHSEAARWALEHAAELALDILGTEHNWVEDETKACAHTDLVSQAPLTLSYVTCRPTSSVRENVVKLIIHESVHHLGVGEEGFADAVADEVTKVTGEVLPLKCTVFLGNPFAPSETREFFVPYRSATNFFFHGVGFEVSHYPVYMLMIRSNGLRVSSGGQEPIRSYSSVSAMEGGPSASLACVPTQAPMSSVSSPRSAHQSPS